MRRKRRLKKQVRGLAIIVLIVALGIIAFMIINKKDSLGSSKEEKTITDFKDMKIKEVEDYAKKHNLELKTKYIYSDNTKKDIVIKSNLNDKILELTISKGSIPVSEFEEKGVNELGKVPIMMYHQIIDTTPKYTGGNVDKDGYSRTSEAFLKDLEFYYEKGYRMVRLKDYIDGEINVP